MNQRNTGIPVQPNGVRRSSAIAARVCLAAAAVIASYLLWVALRSGSVAGCSPGSACDQVLQSRWSKWFGLPVSAFSLLVYAVLFGASLRLTGRVPAEKLRQAWQVIVPSSLLLLGGAVWFLTLQLAVINAICPYCISAHILGAIAATLLLVQLPLHTAQGKAPSIGRRVTMTPAATGKLSLIALALLGLFVGGQLVNAPAGHIEKPVSAILTNLSTLPVGLPQLLSSSATNSAPVRQAGAADLPPAKAQTAAVTPPASKRVFEIYNGQFKFNLDEVPLIGPPSAARLMVSLFDYTCRHCRTMHERLIEAQRTFSNELAIIALPMPLDPKCNPTMQRTHPDHTNACFYARLGLAVVRADRTKAWQFDQFILKPDRPPSAEDAMAFAAALVGAVSLQAALSDPWVEQQLRQSVSIYQMSFNAGQGAMPQSIIGKRIAVGELRSEDVYRILGEELGLNRSSPPISTQPAR